MNKKTSIFRLHAIILIYSLSTVFAKFVGIQDFLSARFLVFAGIFRYLRAMSRQVAFSLVFDGETMLWYNALMP